MKPIILAGGVGSRLWPQSRAAMPKQFLALTSNQSMLQQTVARLNGLTTQPPVFICNEEHRFIVAEQLRQQQTEHGGILLEPEPRNTAAAITLAALHASKEGDDPILLVLAADHEIRNVSAFHTAVNQAHYLAEQGHLVTFGVTPDKPHTGYGYIFAGECLVNGYHVDRFVEKPSPEVAKSYLKDRSCYWNSGIFMFRASAFLSELKRCQPDVFAACSVSLDREQHDLDFIRPDSASFLACPSVSVDVAVMERTELAAMVPMDAGWSDVGSWQSLWEGGQKDPADNVVKGNVMLESVTKSYVNAGERLVTVIGLDNVIVIDTKDAVMVADKSSAEDIKAMVDTLKSQGRPEYHSHREVFRPWGSYDALDSGSRFQVKRIKVEPGKALSLQMHHHRAEHWVVVTGTARVTIDGESQLLTENESTYIPVGAIHVLENPGKIPLELIEIQTGAYISEDDIVRYADNFGRVNRTDN